MGMQLNIKSDEAYQLASRLSELTGESLTTAVTEALRARVTEEERKRDRDAWVAEIMQAAQALRDELERAGAGPMTSNHDFLYDENGLPA